MGEIIIVIRFEKLSKIPIFNDKGIPHKKQRTDITIEVFILFDLKWVMKASTGPSNMFTEDEIAANITLRKKIMYLVRHQNSYLEIFLVKL